MHSLSELKLRLLNSKRSIGYSLSNTESEHQLGAEIETLKRDPAGDKCSQCLCSSASPLGKKKEKLVIRRKKDTVQRSNSMSQLSQPAPGTCNEWENHLRNSYCMKTKTKPSIRGHDVLPSFKALYLIIYFKI